MKNKELKAFIKSKADNVVINDHQKSILSKVEIKEKTKKNKNKMFIPVLATLAAVFIGVFVYIALPKTPIDTQPTKAKEKLIYEVAALGNAMQSNEYVTALNKARIDKDEASKIANEVHEYLLTGEMMLNKNNIKSVVSENTDLSYDYDYKMEVSYTDNLSYKSQYTLYYNETKKVESGYSIDEVSSYLNGIMLIDGDTFKVKGEKEVEKDEMETCLSIYVNENSYIKISQGFENNENEYEYEYVKDGKEIKSLSLEIEESAFNKTMSISIEKDNEEKEYEFEYHKNYIECKFEDDNKDVEYKIKIKINKEYYLYVFSDDIQIKINK